MKKAKHLKRKIPWPLAWLTQIAALAALGFVLAFSVYLGPVAYGITQWLLMPLAGLFSAYWVTMRGLSNYAAWIAPPMAMWFTHFMSYAYSPEMGPILLCAFVSIVGAAAGEVRIQQGRLRNGSKASEGSKNHGERSNPHL